ncbi:hypothetical protein BDN71DRAFT_1514127 [Pleurotus eryngii]|uniref:Uncharacterized protein n=1 Tax=Pleurotus eryngii TaxID=5323 RepID=A0A9P5ZFV1_PLEER|nr:hypothetical protein BDN71DRAFT_1514127 [Pleurotus eryngii]
MAAVYLDECLYILNRLQSLNDTMSEVHDTLGGLLPSNLPPYPLVRPLQPSDIPTPEPEPKVHPAIPPTVLSDYKPNSMRPKLASPPMSTRVRVTGGLIQGAIIY